MFSRFKGLSEIWDDGQGTPGVCTGALQLKGRAVAGNLKAAQELTQVVVLGRDSTLRSLFQNAGFTQVEVVRHFKQAREHIQAGHCDMLIMDEFDHEQSPLSLIAEIRQRKLGSNPYLPMIMILAGQDEKTATKYILAGVDDVWAKPLSPQVLNSRVKRLAESDFEYEVAADYMGPKRPIRGEVDQSSLMSVPNVVRLKAEGVTDISALISDSIRATEVAQNQQTAAVQGSEITKLIKDIGKADDPDIAAKLEELEQAAEKFSDSVSGMSHDKFHRMAKVLVRNIQALQKAPTDSGLQLLALLAQAVELSFAASDELNNKAWEIIKLIDAQIA